MATDRVLHPGSPGLVGVCVADDVPVPRRILEEEGILPGPRDAHSGAVLNRDWPHLAPRPLQRLGGQQLPRARHHECTVCHDPWRRVVARGERCGQRMERAIEGGANVDRTALRGMVDVDHNSLSSLCGGWRDLDVRCPILIHPQAAAVAREELRVQCAGAVESVFEGEGVARRRLVAQGREGARTVAARTGWHREVCATVGAARRLRATAGITLAQIARRGGLGGAQGRWCRRERRGCALATTPDASRRRTDRLGRVAGARWRGWPRAR
mmetsp:Transcript_11276/g.33851  ORF Transcript_11276/g.33851 Transcript_11276/m.33851 type:complete len:270 (-) Transcript_11276:362-1171(-)